MKVKHILVPTDFSERSEQAIRLAGSLVDYFECTVDLIHTVPVLKYFHDSMDPLGVPFSLEKHVYPFSIERAEKKLEALAEKYIRKEYRGKLIVHIERKASELIVRQAKEGHYDLILMSAKGEHNSIHVMGGTTEKVIRLSETPVLSVNTEVDESRINKILVPIDFSESSFISVVAAYELARELNAEIELLHVVELYSMGSDLVPYMPAILDTESTYEQLITRLNEYLLNHEQYELSIQRTGIMNEDYLVYTHDAQVYSIKIKTTIVKGISAHREIVDYANEHADLVVISTHGRTGLARVLIGSTAEQVSRQIQKPLLTVRPQYFEELIE